MAAFHVLEGTRRAPSRAFWFALGAEESQSVACELELVEEPGLLMTHHEKLERMYRHMAALGVSKSTAAPPAWRLLWRFGVEVPPPLFAPFVPGALAMGAFFGLFWGLLMWAILWSRQGMPVGLMVASALLAGTLFGLVVAAYFRYVARRHRLPPWAEYTGTP